jgi:hypothetical protein
MTTERSVFFLGANEFLFMVRDPDHGWIPHLPTVAAWRAGHLRIYRPPPPSIPNAGTPQIITMPGHVRWSIMTPQEAEEIHAVIRRPWIPATAAYDSIPESAIADMDPVIARGDIEELARPALLWEDYPLDVVLVPPPPEPSAPPGPAPPPTTLPAHVATILISHAVATGAVCPISLTPIDAATAVATLCGHVFDGDTLRAWIERSSSLQRQHVCPECRAQI